MIAVGAALVAVVISVFLVHQAWLHEDDDVHDEPDCACCEALEAGYVDSLKRTQARYLARIDVARRDAMAAAEAQWIQGARDEHRESIEVLERCGYHEAAAVLRAKASTLGSMAEELASLGTGARRDEAA